MHYIYVLYMYMYTTAIPLHFTYSVSLILIARCLPCLVDTQTGGQKLGVLPDDVTRKSFPESIVLPVAKIGYVLLSNMFIAEAR